MIKDIKTMEPRYKGRQQNTFIGRNLARSTILNLYLEPENRKNKIEKVSYA
jgi:hypothetical protein